MTARHGLLPLGEVGATLEYEPDKHDLVGPTAPAGVAVVVRHCGYTWAGPDGEIVLARALVEQVA